MLAVLKNLKKNSRIGTVHQRTGAIAAASRAVFEPLELRQFLSASPTIVTTATPATVALGASGATLSDKAVLSNGNNPTGKIVFTLTGPSGFSYTQADTLTGNGTYTASDTLPATAAVGTYSWTATYAGDANNGGAADQASALAAFDASLPTTASELLTIPSAIPQPSYFNVTLTNAGSINGSYQDYCVNSSQVGVLNIGLNANVYPGAGAAVPAGFMNMPQNLPQVNYILNQYYVGATGPTGVPFTYSDVQIAIWTLVDTNPPNTVGGHLGSFSQANVNYIVNQANANGQNFVPGFGQWSAVILQPVNAAGQTSSQVTIARIYIGKQGTGTSEQTIVTKSSPNPGITIVKLTNGVNDPNPSAANELQLAPGTPITWTYLVTNTGNVPFPRASVVVTDNQPGVTPTPLLTAGFITGDTNDNNILDPGETWTYQAKGFAVNVANPPAGVMTVPVNNAGSFGPISLGVAGQYAVVAPNGFNINGPGTINGNIASGNNTVLTNPAVINGTVYYSGSAPSGNIKPSGGEVSANLSPVFAAAEAASAAAFALPATQTLGMVSNARTIQGNGGVNVVDLSGINLSNGALTLNGTANDVFIINVKGSITSSNSNIAISGGVLPSHVLINVSGNVTITGGGPNNFYGTILDPNGAISVHDKLLTGELIGNTIVDTSGFSVTYQPKMAYENIGTVAIAGTNLLASYDSSYTNIN